MSIHISVGSRNVLHHDKEEAEKLRLFRMRVARVATQLHVIRYDRPEIERLSVYQDALTRVLAGSEMHEVPHEFIDQWLVLGGL